VIADSAEYYRSTREVVTTFNNLIDGVTRLIDHVRSYPPTRRAPDERIWGPFPAERDPSFEVQMRIQRMADPSGPGFHFEYQIEFHRVGDAADRWHPLITGHFDPGARLRRGRGGLMVLLAEARVQGYPVAEWGQVETIAIEYQRLVYPHTVDMIITNVALADTPRATVNYSENADGSGQMLFELRLRDNIWAQAIAVRTRWLASGAGRGDARVTEGLAALSGNVGIDCWGPDTRATYSRRDFEPKRMEGDPASCVFPDP